MLLKELLSQISEASDQSSFEDLIQFVLCNGATIENVMIDPKEAIIEIGYDFPEHIVNTSALKAEVKKNYAGLISKVSVEKHKGRPYSYGTYAFEFVTPIEQPEIYKLITRIKKRFNDVMQ